MMIPSNKKKVFNLVAVLFSLTPIKIGAIAKKT